MRTLTVFAVSAFAATSLHAADLTPTELRWLEAGWPAVKYAQAQKLPLDIVVQPQAKPGDAPLAMGFVQQRCKLVLSMRGNPEAEATLASIEPDLLNAVVESMVAHELGHCWRYVNGAWHTLPAGFVESAADSADRTLATELVQIRRDMRETRREEGYADLVGLAWTLTHHPAHYERVHAWYTQVREDQPVPGAHHDTRAWLRLAVNAAAFPSGGNLFERAWPLWQRGLLLED
ncbi:MAG: hypothetical protein V4739_02640 [Pseudomonadota bacterium]